MNSQLHLTFPSVTATDADLQWFIVCLNQSRQWHTASELLRLANRPDTDANRRWLRRLAEASDGQIISGQLGYRATCHSTPEEIHHAAAWLEHQAAAMAARARAIRRRAHAIIHSPIHHATT